MQVQTNPSKHMVLISVNIINGGLLGERKDRQASELVQSTYQVSDKRAKASKYLIDRSHKAVKEVVAAAQRVREVVYRYSVPWGDEKMRGVMVALLDEFRVKLEYAVTELKAAWSRYDRAYPDLRDQSELELGPLFDPSQYPDPCKIMDLFKININYFPFPETGHFVADMSAEAAKEAREGLEREIDERLVAIAQNIVDRAKKVVGDFIDKIDSVDARMDSDKQKWSLSGVIRDSIVDNIADTANLIDRMNFTQNANITKIVKDLHRLCAFSVEHWRNRPAEYKAQKPQALTAANEIMAQLNALNVRDQEVADMIADGGEYLD